MSRPARRRRGWWGAVLLVAGLGAVVALGLERGRSRTAARGAFPPTSGTLRIAGLDAPVTILRDAHGVPHVLAEGEVDAWFGLGFAHAQDRLAQMLWLVRLARGRTAEVSGRAGVPADRLARVLDLGGVADAEWEELAGGPREALGAYARGVNARIGRVLSGEVAPPVAVAKAQMPLEPWHPADSLAVLKLYAWGLSGSLDASLVLNDLLGQLGGVEARPFFPERGDAPGGGASAVTAAWGDPLRAALGLAGRTAGSSAWVVGGAHTASGLPLLAADAHLEPTLPPLLHLARVRGGELDALGAAVPGVPVFWTGHNRRVAWASTHAHAAVTDLYFERIDEEGERGYHDGRRWRPLRRRVEQIVVRDAEPEVLEVRSTGHGPLLDALLPADTRPLAIAWVGLRGGGGSSVAALQGVARSSGADAFLQALSGVSEPALAVVYADADGHAGMHVTGWIPRRPLATDLVPVPGRARWFDWTGAIPFEALPGRRIENGRGWLVASDNRLADPGAERTEWLWRSGARARRIEAVLRRSVAQGPVELSAMTALQRDVADPGGPPVAAAALALVDEAALGPEAAEVSELLRDWDGSAAADSVGAAAYHAFLSALTRELLRGPLGDDLMQRYLAVPQADPTDVVARIVRAASGGDELVSWGDPERTTAAVHAALREAWFELSSRLGANRRKWRWGRLHPLTFEPFGVARWAGLESLGPVEAGGSAATVSTAEYAPGNPFDVRLASLFRFAVDAAALDRSVVVLAPGQSEHPGHRHHTDALAAWREGREATVGSDPAALEATPDRLLLEPAR